MKKGTCDLDTSAESFVVHRKQIRFLGSKNILFLYIYIYMYIYIYI